MKFKHVKAMLIGATGIAAAGGIAVSQKAALHTASEASVEEKEVLTLTGGDEALFAGVKLAVLPDMESGETDIEALDLAKTMEAGEDLMPAASDEEQTKENELSLEEIDTQDNDAADTAADTKEEEKEITENVEEPEVVTETGPEQEVGDEAIQEIKDEDTDEADENKGEDSLEEEEAEQEIVIATVDNYLHVRSEPHLEGEIVGKLYNHSVGTLLEETESVDDNNEKDIWYRIESGNVSGFVSAEYVLRGEEGRALAEEVGTRIATVDTTTLRIRMEPTTESEIVGLLPEGDALVVKEELEGWVKIEADGTEGYISADYVKLHTENAVAESKEEEERRLAEEAARLEYQRQQQAQQSAPASGAATASGASGGSSSSSKGNAASTSGGLGSRIANYALQFVGNPYVYGGTSLTNGADCSGFVMSVYQNFGISLPRTSGEQGSAGTAVYGIENAKPGDLIAYPGHIGIYIGNGQIVHASTPASGIKVSSATYRSISSIRRIVQ